MRTGGRPGKRVRAAEAEHRDHFAGWNHGAVAIRGNGRGRAGRAWLLDVPDEGVLQTGNARAMLGLEAVKYE